MCCRAPDRKSESEQRLRGTCVGACVLMVRCCGRVCCATRQRAVGAHVRTLVHGAQVFRPRAFASYIAMSACTAALSQRTNTATAHGHAESRCTRHRSPRLYAAVRLAHFVCLTIVTRPSELSQLDRLLAARICSLGKHWAKPLDRLMVGER